MNTADYELLAQIGAGPDGVSFRARRVSDGRPVEFRSLAAARGDDVHWQRLTHRLRLARLLEQPGARRVLAMDLDADPPWLTVEFADGQPLTRALDGRLPLPPAEALAFASYLTAVLHAAHRLGLAHGDLTPDTVLVTAHPPLLVDFTGTATREYQSRLIPSTIGQFADDIAALGRVGAWLLSGCLVEAGKELPAAVPQAARGVLADMLSIHAEDRPALGDVESRLGEALRGFVVENDLATTRLADMAVPSPKVERPPDQLGRFKLELKLGAGGMGEVWRALDTSNGRTVAVKTLLPEHTRNPAMLKRFLKEARLLAEVNTPFVANLLEVNEDNSVHYLAVEYVAGKSVGAMLEEKGNIGEDFALAIAADVCQALATAHARGVVHRDIKPDNILLLGDGGTQVAKLSDFGLARHVVESESLHLTRTGAIVGTPLYLAPEQCKGDPVDARSDVYSLGATLFHLLAGKPPFTGDGPLAVMQQHLQAPVPSLKPLRPELSDGVVRLIERAMAKSPAHRPADAAELLAEIDRLRRGEPARLEAHPRLPEADPARVLTYDFAWELESSPAELWPHVSNTERLNRAIHLAAVPWTTRVDEDGKVRRLGQLKARGIEVAWEEHPFEWVEGRRFGVLREMTSGPFRWFVSAVELSPRPGGGTTLSHQLRMEPTGMLGRAVAAVQIGFQTRRAFERVYRRIDAVIRGKVGPLADPFEEPASLTRPQQQRLDEGLDRLAGQGVAPAVVERLGAFLAAAPPQDVARVRPLALARRLSLDADATVAACLLATREGLLVLLWDLLCPVCRIPSEIKDTLKALKDHGRCEACNADYELDFGRSVELIFRADPTIRDAELGVFCVGGPAHSPHVVAQVRVGAGERVELELSLTAGAYRLRGPQLPVALELRVEPGPHPTRWEVDLGKMVDRGLTLLRPGGQVIGLVNSYGSELVVRLERTAARDDALTAARASSLALFRELFPGEILAPGRLVSVATVTLLQTELLGLRQLAEQEGESRAFGRLHEHLRDAETVAKQHGGALIKAIGDGTLLAFPDPARALRAMLSLEPDPQRRLALHRGPALAVTINDQLDYFGATVREVAAMREAAEAGERVVSQAVMDDPAVSSLLRAGDIAADLRRAGGVVVHVVRG